MTRLVAVRCARRWLAAGLLVAAPCLVSAQADSSVPHRFALRSGARVRLIVRSTGELVEGELVWQTRDTLAVRQDRAGGGSMNAVVLTSDVLSAQRWASHHSAGAAAAGFGAGLLAGLPIGMVGADHDVAVCKRRRPGNDMCGLAGLSFPFYVLGSGVVGLVVGLHHTTHSWMPAE